MCRYAFYVLLALLCGVGSGARTFAESTAKVNTDRVNVRGQASIFSEVITQLRQGEVVTVLERIKAPHGKPGEPAEWIKIRVPTNTPLWVCSTYIDASDKIVKATKLNIRAGPGENFSSLGFLNKGDTVHEIRVVDNWMEIEAPTNACAFVSGAFLNAEEAPAPSAAPPSGAPTSAPAPRDPAVHTEPQPAPVSTPPATNAAASTALLPTGVASAPAKTVEVGPAAASDKPEPEAAPARAARETGVVPRPTLPAPRQTATSSDAAMAKVALVETGNRRVVRREGILSHTLSIQAPSYYELRAADTGKVLDFVVPTSSKQRVGIYRGLRVVVTGEEEIWGRWPNTPMIEADRIELAP